MIFGRDGSKYLPLFKNGYLRRSAAEAEATGATLSDSDLDAGEHISEQFAKAEAPDGWHPQRNRGGSFPHHERPAGHRLRMAGAQPFGDIVDHQD